MSKKIYRPDRTEHSKLDSENIFMQYEIIDPTLPTRVRNGACIQKYGKYNVYIKKARKGKFMNSLENYQILKKKKKGNTHE
jgi:hypothetical protein